MHTPGALLSSRHTSSGDCPPAPETPTHTDARRPAFAWIASLGLALWALLSWNIWLHAPSPDTHMASLTWGSVLLAPFGAPWAGVFGAPAQTPTRPTFSGSGREQLSPPVCTSGGERAFGSSIVVTSDEWICGNVDAYGGNVTVLGRVSGDVQAIRGDVTVLGEV
ncbi:MAG TPA: hypothetical protein VKQ36_15975, partial [Ktedonobacterales bacterium]|nr:hypothetical protein [Ktedonobacterales bacterium]